MTIGPSVDAGWLFFLSVANRFIKYPRLNLHFRIWQRPVFLLTSFGVGFKMSAAPEDHRDSANLTPYSPRKPPAGRRPFFARQGARCLSGRGGPATDNRHRQALGLRRGDE